MRMKMTLLRVSVAALVLAFVMFAVFGAVQAWNMATGFSANYWLVQTVVFVGFLLGGASVSKGGG